jgi:tRNA-dihydrouridine synthase B
MISAKGLYYAKRGGGAGSEALLDTTLEDNPLIIQLFGHEPDILEQVTGDLAERFPAHKVWFDLNMGCSVPKVVKTGSGSALLRDEKQALACAEAMIRAAGAGRVGFKLRLGWQPGEDVYLRLGPALETLGAAWLTLHPRYARQGFSGTADRAALARFKQSVSIPVLGSGDLYTAKDALACLNETGIDGVMFARGAMSSPRVFADLAALHQNRVPKPLTSLELKALIYRHVDLARAFGGERTAVFKMRTFVPRYVKHLPGARALRQEMASCKDWKDLERLLEQYL